MRRCVSVAALGHILSRYQKGLWTALFTAYGWPMVVALGLKIIQGMPTAWRDMSMLMVSVDLLAFAQPQFLRLVLKFIREYQAGTPSNNIAPFVSVFNGSQPTLSPQTPFIISPWSDSQTAVLPVFSIHSTHDAPTHDVPLIQGFVLAGLMFISALAQTAILHQYFDKCYMTGARIRAGLVRAIYNKALVLSSAEKGSRASGDIVNLMSVDAMRIQDLCTYGLISFSGPFQIALAFISLYNLLGWPAFVGVAIMVVSIPLNASLANVLKKMQEVQMKNRDERTRAMTEVLNNIKRFARIHNQAI